MKARACGEMKLECSCGGESSSPSPRSIRSSHKKSANENCQLEPTRVFCCEESKRETIRRRSIDVLDYPHECSD